MRKKDDRLSVIVRTMASMMAVPVATFGFYVALHGHLTPGGGFAGGAIIATVTALFLASHGRGVIKSLHARSFSSLRTIKNIGITLFGVLVILSFFATFLHRTLMSSGWFFSHAVPFGPNPGYLGTGGVIPLMNLAVGLEVVVGLSLAVILLTVVDKDTSVPEAAAEGRGGA